MAIIGANNRNSNLIQNRGGIVDGRNIHNQQNFVQRNTANSRDTALARREYSQYLKERADEEMAEKQRIQEARSKYMAEQKARQEEQRVRENTIDRLNQITFTKKGTAVTINDPNNILSNDQKKALLTGKSITINNVTYNPPEDFSKLAKQQSYIVDASTISKTLPNTASKFETEYKQAKQDQQTLLNNYQNTIKQNDAKLKSLQEAYKNNPTKENLRKIVEFTRDNDVSTVNVSLRSPFMKNISTMDVFANAMDVGLEPYKNAILDSKDGSALDYAKSALVGVMDMPTGIVHGLKGTGDFAKSMIDDSVSGKMTGEEGLERTAEYIKGNVESIVSAFQEDPARVTATIASGALLAKGVGGVVKNVKPKTKPKSSTKTSSSKTSTKTTTTANKIVSNAKTSNTSIQTKTTTVKGNTKATTQKKTVTKTETKPKTTDVSTTVTKPKSNTKKTSSTAVKRKAVDVLDDSDSDFIVNVSTGGDIPSKTLKGAVKTPRGKAKATVISDKNAHKQLETAVVTAKDASTPKVNPDMKNIKTGRAKVTPNARERARVNRIRQEQNKALREIAKQDNLVISVEKAPQTKLSTIKPDIPKGKDGRPIRGLSQSERKIVNASKEAQKALGLGGKKQVQLDVKPKQGAPSKDVYAEQNQALKRVERQIRQEMARDEKIANKYEVRYNGSLSDFKQSMREAQKRRADTKRKVDALNKTEINLSNRRAPRTDEKRTGKARETSNPSETLIRNTENNLPNYDTVIRPDRTISIPKRKSTTGNVPVSEKPLVISRNKPDTKKGTKPVKSTKIESEHEVDVDLGNGQKMKMKVKSESRPKSTTNSNRRKTSNIKTINTKRKQQAKANVKQKAKQNDIKEKAESLQQNKKTTTKDSRVREREVAVPSGKKDVKIRGSTKGRNHNKVTRTQNKTQNKPQIPKKDKIQSDIEKLRQMRKKRQQNNPQPNTPTPKPTPNPTPNKKKGKKNLPKDLEKMIDMTIGGLKQGARTLTTDTALRLSPHPSTFKTEEPTTAEPVTATKPVTLTATSKGTTTTTARTTTTTTGDTTTTATTITSKPKTSDKEREGVLIIPAQAQAVSQSSPTPNRNRNKTAPRPTKTETPPKKRRRISLDEEEEKKKKKIKKLKSFLRNETINQFSWLGIDLEPPMKTQRIVYK